VSGGEVASRRLGSAAVRARLLGVMSSADGLGLGAGAVMRAAAAGRASAETGDGRRGGLGVARRQHERRRETLPVDRVVRLEADQQLATGRYHLRRDLQCIHDTAFSFLLRQLSTTAFHVAIRIDSFCKKIGLSIH